MMLLTLFACLFLAGCSATSEGKYEPVLTEVFFKDDYVIYTGEHDIVKIFAPLNDFNQEGEPYTVFFVQGDFKNDGVMSQGLYVFNKGKVTKLLDDGRDAVATQTNTIYLGDEDGIYKFDIATNTATKHGTVTDSISQFAYNNKTDSIYYLNDDNEVYKLNEDATASFKVEGLTDVQEIAIGFEGKLYYYDSKKVFYVVDLEAGVVPKKITGLPANMNEVLLMAPIRGSKHGVAMFADKRLYNVEGDHNIERLPDIIEVSLTAMAPQAALVHFYGKDKKLYAISYKVFMESVAGQPKPLH